MNYNSINKKSYQAIAKSYAERDRKKITETTDVENALKRFVKLLPQKARVLDLGCGAGRDSQYFIKNNVQIIGIDFSPKMIFYAKKLNPQGIFHIMDFEKLKFKKSKFDGVWANASLHHIPKSHLLNVLKNINKILKKKRGFIFKSKTRSQRRSLKRYKIWSFD